MLPVKLYNALSKDAPFGFESMREDLNAFFLADPIVLVSLRDYMDGWVMGFDSRMQSQLFEAKDVGTGMQANSGGQSFPCGDVRRPQLRSLLSFMCITYSIYGTAHALSLHSSSCLSSLPS